jgi:hypothetical protein
MPSYPYAMVAVLLLHRHRGDQPPVQKGVLVIRLPPSSTVEGLPVVISGSKTEYIAGLRRLRGEPD